MLLHTFQSTYYTGCVLDSLSSVLKGLALSCHTCQSTVFSLAFAFRTLFLWIIWPVRCDLMASRVISFSET